MLDLAAMFTVLAVTNILAVVIMYVIQREGFPVSGAGWWLICFLCLIMGLVLEALRPLFSDFWSYVVRPGLIILGYIFLLLGFRAFLGLARPTALQKFFLIGLQAISLVACHVFSAYHPDKDLRSVFFFGPVALINLWLAYDLRRLMRDRIAARTACLLFLFHALVHLGRVVEHLAGGRYDLFPPPHLPPGVFFLYTVVFNVAVILCIVMVISEDLLHQLKRQSWTDPLTSLFNRRALNRLAAQQLAHMIRHNSSLGLLMMDLDHFKKVNDRYGHPVGDELLVHFAGIMTRVLRGEDLLFRYGGEEFLALLPDVDIAEARIAAERIRREADSTPLETNGYRIDFSVSIGLTQARAEGESIYQAIERADQALYRAKEQGRNQVELLAGGAPAKPGRPNP